ncbi:MULTISPECIES: hypothetical protein [unclassified Streptomyces]|uniref:hypothetical protein n=1 Tax=unclassified Streptomyces TaxID=2593676 RepID=UPI001CC10208|nr:MULTISPECIES: hypothetical protein [unclassified Streptomyces]WPO76644.1 hypothetical protein R9806_39055 [Streptomyces sp. KN37]
MTIVWLALIVVFVLVEIWLTKRSHRRSAWRTLDGDRVALAVGVAWCAIAVATAWADDGDPIGGLLFGGLTGVVVACVVATARRKIAYMRGKNSASC